MREALLLSVGRFICTTPWFIVCCVPFYSQRRVNRRTMALIITLTSIAFFCFNFFLQLNTKDFAEYSSLVFVPLYVVMISFFLLGFRVAWVKILYIFLLVHAVSTAINYTAAILLKPFYPDVRITLQNTASYALAILLLTLIAAPALLYFFTHQLRVALQELRNRDFWLLCIPPTLIFFVTVIFNDLAANPAVPQEQAMAIFLLITVAGLIIYFINVRLALDTARRIRMESDMTAIERQLALQTQSYNQLTQSIEAARTSRHDLRHHLAAMSTFAQQKDFDGLCAYLSEYQQTLGDENELKICENYTVNAVVRQYLSRAKEAGAELDIKLVLPAKLGILDTDLTIVFGNLFENAAQAVAGQTSGRRFINARCGIEHHKLILIVDNSTEPAAFSSKKSMTSLGIGQSSVTAVVKKYQGAVRFTQEAATYRASVFMNITA